MFMKPIAYSFPLVIVISLGALGVVYSNGASTTNHTNEVVDVRKNIQASPTLQTEAYQGALRKALQLLTIPEGYALTSVQSHTQNAEDVWVFRYEKESGENNGLGGEHYSFTVTQEHHKLLGFTWMDRRWADGEPVTKERAKEAAREFLDQVEPGLFAQLENLWIDLHDETITVHNNGVKEAVTVSGMKYKCYLKEQDEYAWVIVGSSGEVITFEQGIKWDNGRLTEKWLHDSWLQAKQ